MRSAFAVSDHDALDAGEVRREEHVHLQARY